MKLLFKDDHRFLKLFSDLWGSPEDHIGISRNAHGFWWISEGEEQLDSDGWDICVYAERNHNISKILDFLKEYYPEFFL